MSWCVKLGRSSFAKIVVRFSIRKLSLNFFEVGFGHLHTTFCGRELPIACRLPSGSRQITYGEASGGCVETGSCVHSDRSNFGKIEV